MKLENERFYLLDCYRTIAAYAVVLFHYAHFYSLGDNKQELEKSNLPLYELFSLGYNYGWLAVQFFFVFSGFIFFNLYLKQINNKKINFKKFFILRFSRLYPLHILTFFIIFYSFFIIDNSPLNNIDLKHFILNLFLIQNWGFEDGNSFNEPAWSISVEILMYGIFYLIARTKKFLLLAMFSLTLLSIFVFFKYKLVGYGGFCFFIGGFTSQLFEFTKRKKKIVEHWSLFCFFFFLSIIIIFALNTYSFSTHVQKIILIVFFFPSFILASVIFPKKNNLFIKKVSIIGNFSYSIYLLHYLILIFLIHFFIELKIFIDFNSLYFLSTYSLIVFSLSIISFYYFERPLQVFIRKRLII